MEAIAPDSTTLTHLRPTVAMEMLDRAFHLLRCRPALFTSLAVLHSLPALVWSAQAWLSPSIDSIIAFQPYWVGLVLLAQWPNAALHAAAFQTLLFPRRHLTMATSLRATSGRVPYYILTQIIVWIILVLIGGVMPAGLLLNVTPDPLGLLSAVMGIWLLGTAIYLAGTWMLVGAVVVVEKKAFGEAIMRSMQLMRQRFDRPWWGDSALRRLLIVIALPSAVFLSTRGLLEGIELGLNLAHRLGPSEELLMLRLKITASFVSELVNTPWLVCALILIYAECRMRREALDLQVRFLEKGDLAIPQPQSAQVEKE